MRVGWIYKHNETGVRVTVTEVKRGKYFTFIHFVDRRGATDFLNDYNFEQQYEIHAQP